MYIVSVSHLECKTIMIIKLQLHIQYASLEIQHSGRGNKALTIDIHWNPSKTESIGKIKFVLYSVLYSGVFKL